MKLLGFHKVIIESAEGMYYIDRKGRNILDFFGGFGSLAFGHNHPRILKVRRKFQEEKRHEIAMAFQSQYASALAYNLAQVSPGDLDMVFLGSSGSEAMEAALKLAEQVQGPERSKILYAENSFHGKTKGVLAVTDGPLYRTRFILSQNNVRVPFGDIGAIARMIEADASIGIVVLETIQGGGGIVTAPPEFWQQLRELCNEHDVFWIADEVQCGPVHTSIHNHFNQGRHLNCRDIFKQYRSAALAEWPFTPWPNEPHEEAPVEEDSNQLNDKSENAGDATENDEVGEAKKADDTEATDNAEDADKPKD